MRLPSSKLVSIQPQQPQHQPNLPRSRGEGQREQLGVLPVALPSARLPETREQVPPSEPRRAQFAADASRRRRTSRLSNKLQNRSQQQQQQKLDTFRRAFSSCIDAKGYSVK